MEVAAGLELKADGHFRYGLVLRRGRRRGRRRLDFRRHECLADVEADAQEARVRSGPRRSRAERRIVHDAGGSRLRLGPWARGNRDGRLRRAGSRSQPTIRAAWTWQASRKRSRSLPKCLCSVPPGRSSSSSQDRGHRLTFRFHRNDLGKARFDREPLKREGGDLLLTRYDTVFRFRKVRP